MYTKEQIERIKVVLKDFAKAVQLADVTTRLMKAFILQVEKDEARRRKEGGGKSEGNLH